MTKQPASNGIYLDAALTLRAVHWNDLNAATQLIYNVCEAKGDTSVAYTPDDLENEWKYEGFNPEQDAFIVETSDGRMAGYAALFNVKNHCDLSGDVYVHPKFSGLGVRAALLRAMEIRAREHIQLSAADLRAFIRITDHKDEASEAILAREGYTPIRYQWRMGIDLDAAPPAPILPSGFEIRPFVKDEHVTAVWQARNESFQNNWGSHQLTFEEFAYLTFEDPEYDPALWVVIWDGAEAAGFSINQYRMDIGWIHILGVRPAWRAKGLGLALLRHSFGEFYKRGTTAIGLAVDASNVTGATRLYQKAGMNTVSEFVTFEKELRAGL
ncbi:MAG: GNAT family N-acetyltransferase [Anaerolineales bacterium]|nr:GNAT family N-acetyltransferase [Anaerolineales bacterium]